MSVDERETTPDDMLELPGIGELVDWDRSPALDSGLNPDADRPQDSLDELAELPEPPTIVPQAEPVSTSERVGSVDVLRGIALLGILAMNINGFGWPGNVYENPTARPGAGPFEIVLWGFNHLVFDTKMMTLFSMLFGAGLVLMDSRAEAKGASIRGVYYRRTFWLLMIGLVHSYLIWDGDILVMYASCGFFLYLFRRKTPKTLLIVGVALTLVVVPITLAMKYGLRYVRHTAARVEAELRLDIPQSRLHMIVADQWAKARPEPIKEAKKAKETMDTFRGGYPGIVRHRAKDLIWGQTLGFLFFGWWFTGGRMLIGMALMKLGVFSAARSMRTYAWMAIAGYGIGLPLMAVDTYLTIQYNWSFINYEAEGGFLFNMLGGIIVVIGHIGLVMMIWKARLLEGLTRRLGAAGRMALSNYLFDSIVCTTLFYGYGLKQFARLDRGQLYLVVLAIWAFQLWFSPIWLSRFRYGPAEWLWRSLTYRKFQKMRIDREPSLVAEATLATPLS